jgi:hypothetical protein
MRRIAEEEEEEEEVHRIALAEAVEAVQHHSLSVVAEVEVAVELQLDRPKEVREELLRSPIRYVFRQLVR